ncbi:MAG TPA: peptidoglycan-binding protein [Gammaproteobacteria bacterium]|nr:peptidoglycan-binding protein [Gammaproteobacteria bacterium]
MLTREQLVGLYPKAPPDHVEAFLADEDRLFRQHGLADKSIRLHYFLAQIGHESGGLTISVENLSYSPERLMQVWPSRFPTIESAQPFAKDPEALANEVYSDRMGNGPPGSGDGFRYRGRGYIQITGKDGYREVGQRAAEMNLVAQPDDAAAPATALEAACAFWTWKGLNEFCDAGDFKKVTRKINGGLVGLVDRRAWLDKVRRTLAEPENVEDLPEDTVIVEMQRELQRRGFTEIGTADGDVGRRTIAAITRFRAENGLPEGVVDDALLKALGVDT